MKAIVEGASGIGGTVAAPPSKSYTHRAFIVASLAEGESVIENPLLAGDTLSTLNAMRAFGVKIEEKDANISVFDHGLMYGDGVYETLVTYRRRVFRLNEHIERLYKISSIS